MRVMRTLAIFLVLAACSSDSPTGNDDKGAGTYAARVDGQAWSAEVVEALHIGNVFSVTGNDGDLNITLSVAAEGTGTYDLTAGSAAAVISEGSDSWYAVGLGGSGTITVTSLDAHGAKGTFAFTGGSVPGSGTTGTRTVTQGTFDVTF